MNSHLKFDGTICIYKTYTQVLEQCGNMWEIMNLRYTRPYYFCFAVFYESSSIAFIMHCNSVLFTKWNEPITSEVFAKPLSPPLSLFMSIKHINKSSCFFYIVKAHGIICFWGNFLVTSPSVTSLISCGWLEVHSLKYTHLSTQATRQGYKNESRQWVLCKDISYNVLSFLSKLNSQSSEMERATCLIMYRC